MNEESCPYRKQTRLSIFNAPKIVHITQHIKFHFQFSSFSCYSPCGRGHGKKYRKIYRSSVRRVKTCSLATEILSMKTWKVFCVKEVWQRLRNSDFRLQNLLRLPTGGSRISREEGKRKVVGKRYEAHLHRSDSLLKSEICFVFSTITSRCEVEHGRGDRWIRQWGKNSSITQLGPVNIALEFSRKYIFGKSPFMIASCRTQCHS